MNIAENKLLDINNKAAPAHHYPQDNATPTMATCPQNYLQFIAPGPGSMNPTHPCPPARKDRLWLRHMTLQQIEQSCHPTE